MTSPGARRRCIPHTVLERVRWKATDLWRWPFPRFGLFSLWSLTAFIWQMHWSVDKMLANRSIYNNITLLFKICFYQLEIKIFLVTPFPWQCPCMHILPPGFERTLSKMVWGMNHRLEPGLYIDKLAIVFQV